MKKINKQAEPDSLKQWKQKNSHKQYKDLTGNVRQAIRKQCIEEQYCLCAYCCKKITESNCHNEHIEAQQQAQQKTLSYDNIVASCNTEKQCGRAHGAKSLGLTPLTKACETDLKFYLTGHVKGLTKNANDTIEVLNLNNRSLTHTRKQLVNTLIYAKGEDPNDIELLDDDLLNILLDDIRANPANKKCLKPFSPVLANILKKFLR